MDRVETMHIPVPADWGCEETTDAATPAGQRAFRCPWADRFAAAHRLVQLFGNVQLTGEGDPVKDAHGSVIGWQYARIVAGRAIR